MTTGRSLSDSSIPLENIFRKTGLLEARTAVLTGTFCVEDSGPAKDGSKNSKTAQTGAFSTFCQISGKLAHTISIKLNRMSEQAGISTNKEAECPTELPDFRRIFVRC
jgi:hypothetical protein